MLKSTKRKLITSIICFAACASLVGVGFSVWTAGGGSGSGTADGDFVADEAPNIKINSTISVDPFCQDGFVIGDFNNGNGYEISYTGYIKLSFIADLSLYTRTSDIVFKLNSNIVNSFPANPSIYFDYSKINSWAYGSGSSENPELNNNGSTLSGYALDIDFGSLPIGPSTNYYYFGVEFKIVSSKENFKNEIYTYLKDTKFEITNTYTIS